MYRVLQLFLRHGSLFLSYLYIHDKRLWTNITCSCTFDDQVRCLSIKQIAESDLRGPRSEPKTGMVKRHLIPSENWKKKPNQQIRSAWIVDTALYPNMELWFSWRFPSKFNASNFYRLPAKKIKIKFMDWEYRFDTPITSQDCLSFALLLH